MTSTNTNSDKLQENYIGDGVTTDFYYKFNIQSTKDIKVYINNILQINGYIIIENASGGIVKFNTAPEKEVKISIVKKLDLESKLLITPSTKYLSPQSLKIEFDNLLDLIIQLNNRGEKSLAFPIHVTNISTDLPIPDANKALVWNSQANQLENSKNNFYEIDKALNEAFVNVQKFHSETANNTQIVTEKTNYLIENFSNIADTNLSNITKESGLRRLIDNWHDDNGNWYKIFEEIQEDGSIRDWIEQGGRIIHLSASNYTLTFPRPFIDINYKFIPSNSRDTGGSAVGSQGVRTNNSLIIANKFQGIFYGLDIDWLAFGYGS